MTNDGQSSLPVELGTALESGLTDLQRQEAFNLWKVSSLQFRVDLLVEEVLGASVRSSSHEYSYKVHQAESLKEEGWLRLARRAMCLSGGEVAERLQISRGNYFRYEDTEKDGRVSLGSMSKLAEAMGCEFVYAIRPARGTYSEAIWNELAEFAEDDYRLRAANPNRKVGIFVRRFVAMTRETLVRRTFRWTQRLPRP